MPLIIKITLALFGLWLSSATLLASADYDEQASLAFNLGMAQARSNDFRSALRSFRKATQYDSTFAAAYLNIGACHERLNEFDKAKPFYEKALKLDKDNARFAFIYGLALMRHKEVYPGLRQLENAVYAAPDDPDYVYELGVAYLCLTQRVEAAKCFRAAVDVSTNYGSAWYRLGMMELEGKNTNEALRLFDKVELNCELAPQSYLMKSRILRRERKLGDAESAARMALKLRKGFSEAYLVLAHILKDEKKYREACDILERVELTEAKSNWGAFLGAIYEEWGDDMNEKGDRKAAETLYGQALRFRPEDQELIRKAAPRKEGP
ncbi:tetratricopeptide repeat protein [bacterium]|nr:tetratricopeptide repeat protein [bacterium]